MSLISELKHLDDVMHAHCFSWAQCVELSPLCAHSFDVLKQKGHVLLDVFILNKRSCLDSSDCNKKCIQKCRMTLLK